MRKIVVFIVALCVPVIFFAIPAGAVVPPPPNDNFPGTTVAQLPYTDATTSNVAATTETGEPGTPSCTDATGATEWYSFTPAQDIAVAADTIQSNFDTVLVVYTGQALGSLTEIACNDDSGPDFGSWSRVGLTLHGGTTYYFQVGGWFDPAANPQDPSANPSTGNVVFHLTQRTPRAGVVRGNVWHLRGPGGGEADSFAFGRPGDVPLPGTWKGDGISKPALRRGNTWAVNNWFDGSTEFTVPFGRATDFPLVGDWDGDTFASPGVRRGNVWYVTNTVTGLTESFSYGRPTDYPIVGDWNGDGIDTPGVIRGNVWYLNNGFDGSADIVFAYGRSTDFPVVGDWNGDGIATPGVVRGNTWYLNNGFDGTADQTFTFGRSTDFPIAGDWDGAGVLFPASAAGVRPASAKAHVSR